MYLKHSAAPFLRQSEASRCPPIFSLSINLSAQPHQTRNLRLMKARTQRSQRSSLKRDVRSHHNHKYLEQLIVEDCESWRRQTSEACGFALCLLPALSRVAFHCGSL